MRQLLDTDQLNFAQSYLVKNSILEKNDVAGWNSRDFDRYIAEMDKSAYKRMMTAYRVAKKRKNDKESGADLVSITITQESHAILKSLATSRGVTLTHVVEKTGLQRDLMLTRDLESLRSECDGYRNQIDELKFQFAERDGAKPPPEQTWCFSPEELQEQAKLIERLTTENARLTAELQLARKAKPELAPVDINALDKIQLLQLLKQLENREKSKTFRHGWHHHSCECLTAKGDPCKNIAEEIISQELSIDVCKVHYQKYKHLD